MTTTPTAPTPEQELALTIAVFLEVAFDDDSTDEELRSLVKSTYANISEGAMTLIEDPKITLAVETAAEMYRVYKNSITQLQEEAEEDAECECVFCEFDLNDDDEEYTETYVGGYDYDEPIDYVPAAPFRPITSASDLLSRLGL